jgi:hypothetical protein
MHDVGLSNKKKPTLREVGRLRDLCLFSPPNSSSSQNENHSCEWLHFVCGHRQKSLEPLESFISERGEVLSNWNHLQDNKYSHSGGSE